MTLKRATERYHVRDWWSYTLNEDGSLQAYRLDHASLKVPEKDKRPALDAYASILEERALVARMTALDGV